jgi:outer membrane protein assembly factor BamB
MSFFEKRKYMKKTRILIFTAILGISLALSGCVPGPRVTGAPGLDISDDLVFVAYGPFTYAMNLETKAVAWHFPDEANSRVVFYAQPLVQDGFAYVGDLANNFYKIDVETGNEVWTFSEAKGFFVGHAAIEDDMVFAPSNDGHVYKINANGEEEWRFETGHYVWAQPQLTEDQVYIASMDHLLYAVAKDTGQENWSYEMQGAIISPPVISENGEVLYIGSIGKEMVALSTSETIKDDERVLWAFNDDGKLESIWGRSILHENTLYFADSSGNIYALDAETGKPVWQSPIEFSGSIIGGLTQVEDGFVFASEEGDIQKYNFDAVLVWQRSIEGEIFQAPVVNGEYLVIGALEAEELVHVFDLAGNPVWSDTPEK